LAPTKTPPYLRAISLQRLQTFGKFPQQHFLLGKYKKKINFLYKMCENIALKIYQMSKNGQISNTPVLALKAHFVYLEQTKNDIMSQKLLILLFCNGATQ